MEYMHQRCLDDWIYYGKDTYTTPNVVELRVVITYTSRFRYILGLRKCTVTSGCVAVSVCLSSDRAPGK